MSNPTDGKSLLSMKEEIQKNRNIDPEIMNVIDNNKVLKNFDTILLQMANNSDKSEREMMTQQVNDFWNENKRIENNIDDLLAEMSNVDEKVFLFLFLQVNQRDFNKIFYLNRLKLVT